MRKISKLNKPEVINKDGQTKVSATFEAEGKEYKLWFKGRDINTDEATNSFLVATLIPSMKLGHPLVVEGEVSPRLFKALDKIQDIFSTWYPELNKISIEAKCKTATSQPDNNKEVASFFTGGVDSFYTLLKHKKKITKLVYAHGFDVWLHEKKFRKMLSSSLNEAAKDLNKELIEIETNIHEFCSNFSHWGYHYHGAALASVAIILSNKIEEFYFPSTHTYLDLFPWGSHPLVDRYWSIEGLNIIHDGAEVDRFTKTERVAKNNIALKHLRVCLDRSAGRYNCSKCEKCIRTMIALNAVGSLEDCSTFESTLDPQMISGITIEDENTYSFVLENYNELKKRQDSAEVRDALAIPLENYINSQIATKINDSSSFITSKYFQNVKPKIVNELLKTEKKTLLKAILKAKVRDLDAKLLRGALRKSYAKFSSLSQNKERQ